MLKTKLMQPAPETTEKKKKKVNKVNKHFSFIPDLSKTELQK